MKLLRRQQKAPLNNKTPKWFLDWHTKYYGKLDDRTKRNERLIYILLTAMLGTAVIKGEGVVAVVLKIADFFGG